MSELRGIAGPDSEIEVLSHDSGLQRPDLGLFETLSDVLKERDPDGIPVLMPGSTDGRLFAPPGVQNYGLLPMLLPETFDFAATIMGLTSVCGWPQSTLDQGRLPLAPKVWTLPVILPGPCLSLFDVV